MKLQNMLFLAAAALLGCAGQSSQAADQTEKPVQRIGIYDSRALAYAHFWSDAAQRRLQELMAAARAAKSSGDQQQFKKLGAELKAEQDRSHLQVFSTAPAEEALAALKDRLPEIQKEAKVDRLVSKWDEATLQQYSKAEKVDVTDRLVQEFKPKEKQLKMIESIKGQKPISLEKCRELIKKDKI